MEAENYKPKPTVERTDEERLKEYNEFTKAAEGDSGNTAKLSEKDLQDMARAETKKDKQFSKFKKRVDHEPEQVPLLGCNPKVHFCLTPGSYR